MRGLIYLLLRLVTFRIEEGLYLYRCKWRYVEFLDVGFRVIWVL